jgi:trk system potassium uptake protein TrkH
MNLQLRSVIHVLGLLLLINAAFMTMCLTATFYYHTADLLPILLSATITGASGFVLWILNRPTERPNIRKREAFLIVTLGWVVMSASGALPYLLSGSINTFTDAFFETMSGYTTTGASTIVNLDVIAPDILLWRSVTHWIGGMGIIVLAVAILPILGIGGMQLFVAEAPGVTTDKISPRITDTAKRLWMIYVGLTLAQIIALSLAGMTLFDAINHSFATIATGGFGTHNDSIAGFSPLIQYIIAFFMAASGVNFILYYFVLKGKWIKSIKDEELRFYIGAIALFTFISAVTVLQVTEMDVEEAFRHSLFSVISIMTSTGFATADYTLWGPAMNLMFFLLLFCGAMAGSTTGGIKIVRHVVLIKNMLLELRRQLHPSAVLPVRLNGRSLHQELANQVTTFVMVYIIMWVICSMVVAFSGVEITTSMSAVATCMGGVGPGIGDVGPSTNFEKLPDLATWVLSFAMLLGRLELFTVLILFTPYFWRSRG